ncbi:endonuclease V [uncultured Lacinutrix sp.]|uniref:endonuclease V n=1 Tax=uncultured Lacinutrix sp. TaxID=574032 RepID=UPI002629F5AF|nr:endonuclease V [uncultured Lacinutrix sp.]
MIIAFDTYYYDNKAKTVGVSFNKWNDNQPIEIYSEIIEGVAEYEPGSFYKREMPCIISLLKKININEVELILVDGYVILNNDGKYGLGGHLYKYLNEKIPIVGVAKSGYDSNTLNSKALLRGESKKPLYISAIGIELDLAYTHIKSMHGNYRIPTLLQIMDTKTKENCG